MVSYLCQHGKEIEGRLNDYEVASLIVVLLDVATYFFIIIKLTWAMVSGFVILVFWQSGFLPELRSGGRIPTSGSRIMVCIFISHLISSISVILQY